MLLCPLTKIVLNYNNQLCNSLLLAFLPNIRIGFSTSLAYSFVVHLWTFIFPLVLPQPNMILRWWFLGMPTNSQSLYYTFDIKLLHIVMKIDIAIGCCACNANRVFLTYHVVLPSYIFSIFFFLLLTLSCYKSWILEVESQYLRSFEAVHIFIMS